MARFLLILVVGFLAILTGSIIAVEFAPSDWFIYEWGQQFLDALESLFRFRVAGPSLSP